MAVTAAGFVEVRQIDITKSTSVTVTSPAITPQPGELLVLKLSTNSGNCVLGAVSDSKGLTWTVQALNTASSTSGALIATARVPAGYAGGSLQARVAVTVGSLGAGDVEGVLERWAGVEVAASPVVVKVANTSSAAATAQITPARPSSVLTWIVGDYNGVAPTNPTYANNATSEVAWTYPSQSGVLTTYAAWQTGPVTPAATTVGVTSPTGQVPTILALELVVGWHPDLSQADSVAAGFKNSGSNRQSGSQSSIPSGGDTTVAFPIATEAAPYGRAGRALAFTIPDNYTRYETTPPDTANSFVEGDDLYFGFAFALDPAFPLDSQEFQVVWQIHGAPGTGSPPIAIEVRQNQIRLTGGNAKPKSDGTNTGATLAYDRLLVDRVETARWYACVVHLKFSAAVASSVADVWIDGTQLVAGFNPPCALVYDVATVGSTGGASYLKFGIYHRASVRGLTIHEAGQGIATTYAAVDPTSTTDRVGADRPQGAEQGAPRESLRADTVQGDRPTGAEQGAPRETTTARPQGPLDQPTGQVQGAPRDTPAIGVTVTDTPTGQEAGHPRGSHAVGVVIYDTATGTVQDAPADSIYGETVIREGIGTVESGAPDEVELALPPTLTLGDVGPTELDLSVAGAPQVSLATLRFYGWLGPAFTEGDAAAGYPLLRYLESAGRPLQDVEDLVRDSGSAPGWSAPLDLTRAPTYGLPWLGQLVGVTVDPTIPDAAQRQQIATQSGQQRGTVSAIRQVALSWLQGPTPTVEITERDGNEWTFTVAVYAAQLVGRSYASLGALYPTYQDLSAAYPAYQSYAVGYSELYQALQQVKPAGLLLNLIVRTGPSYAALARGWATYDALAAAFPTYDQMTGSQPVSS